MKSEKSNGEVKPFGVFIGEASYLYGDTWRILNGWQADMTYDVTVTLGFYDVNF